MVVVAADLGEAALQDRDDSLQQTRVLPQLGLHPGAQRQQVAQQEDLDVNGKKAE